MTDEQRDDGPRDESRTDAGPCGSGAGDERVREARQRARQAAREAFREEWRHRRDGHRARKGRVLHTRISEDLSEDIRRLADDLRVPVSNLVRNVLEEAFGVVERVSDDVGDILDDVLKEAEGARRRFRRSRARRGQHSHRRGRSSRRSSEADIEDELSRDEESEAGSREADRPPKEFPDVLGWQPLVLNVAQACAACDVHLQKGERAFLGVKGDGMSRTALCAECVRGM